MSSLDNSNNNPKDLKLNIDYYLENGYKVFTEKYHLDRGYCCTNGCRHCPYKDKKANQKK